MMKHEQIIKIVCEEFSVTKEQFYNVSRVRKIVEARMATSAVLNLIYGYSTVEISCIVHKSHATVIHYLQTHKNLIDVDESYRLKYGMVIKALDEPHYLITIKNEKFSANGISAIMALISGKLQNKKMITLTIKKN